MSEQLHEFIPVGLLILVAVGFAATNILLPSLIGKKRVHGVVKDSAYECGLPAESGSPARSFAT